MYRVRLVVYQPFPAKFRPANGGVLILLSCNEWTCVFINMLEVVYLLQPENSCASYTSLYGFNPDLRPFTLTWGYKLGFRCMCSLFEKRTAPPPLPKSKRRNVGCDVHRKGYHRILQTFFVGGLWLLFLVFLHVSDHSAGGSGWWWIDVWGSVM